MKIRKECSVFKYFFQNGAFKLHAWKWHFVISKILCYDKWYKVCFIGLDMSVRRQKEATQVFFDRKKICLIKVTSMSNNSFWTHLNRFIWRSGHNNIWKIFNGIQIFSDNDCSSDGSLVTNKLTYNLTSLKTNHNSISYVRCQTIFQAFKASVYWTLPFLKSLKLR